MNPSFRQVIMRGDHQVLSSIRASGNATHARRMMVAAAALGRLDWIMPIATVVSRKAELSWGKVIGTAAAHQPLAWTQQLLAALSEVHGWSKEECAAMLSASLQTAASSGSVPAAGQLFALGVNPYDDEGEALSIAMAQGRREMVLFLIPRCDLMKVGAGLIELAGRSADLEIFDALRDHRPGYNRMEDLVTAMGAAAAQGHGDFLKALLDRSPMAEMTEKMIEEGILKAASASHTDILDQLWDHPRHRMASAPTPSWYLDRLMTSDQPPVSEEALRWFAGKVTHWPTLLINLFPTTKGWERVEAVAQLAPWDVQVEWAQRYPNELPRTAVRVLTRQREGQAQAQVPGSPGRHRRRT